MSWAQQGIDDALAGVDQGLVEHREAQVLQVAGPARGRQRVDEDDVERSELSRAVGAQVLEDRLLGQGATRGHVDPESILDRP
ncbi:hypothetical protein MFU01_22960 [Myxococcus fulvus]|uniref:Uncharacterized protein n=1 Tax=Myxococcus fulvus TaxID=33 RepID=A0A511SZD5_MYXFU|nr:hypothetical protein MFU01_22960 [Myxococcus fulvus]